LRCIAVRQLADFALRRKALGCWCPNAPGLVQWRVTARSIGWLQACLVRRALDRVVRTEISTMGATMPSRRRPATSLVVLRRSSHAQPLAPRASPVRARHVQRGPGLVDEGEPRRVEVWLRLEPGIAEGNEADIVVLDARATLASALRMEAAQSLAKELFVLQTLGDDRAIADTYVAGVPQKGAAGA
jgi:hypothetical protein